MNCKKLFSLFFAALISVSVAAQAVEVNPNHPDRYVVVKGDTLWDISERFLLSPWLWPEVWYVNPQIANPHLIYPGDVISLVYVDGKPQLRLDRGRQTVKLSPEARPEPLDKAIPTIPIDAIKPFLSQPLVVSKDELEKAPYLVAPADERLLSASGDRVYVRGVDGDQETRFHIYRQGDELKDPDTNELLGYEALYIGEAAAQAFGDPTTMKLNRSVREARIGDRAKPAGMDSVDVNFLPRAPDGEINGKIISVVDGVSQIGQYQVVVLNRGTREGLQSGNVLSIYQAGNEIRDPVKGGITGKVQLPDEYAGVLIVFRTFEKVSYALVMRATRPIHVFDFVRNP